jgi:hypothetical protein
MQAVGSNCDSCGKRIASILEGEGCIRCKKAFHFECLQPPKADPYSYRQSAAAPGPVAPERATCPLCGLGFKDQQMTVEVARAVEHLEVQKRGGPIQRRFAQVMIAVGVLATAILYFTHHGEPSAPVLRQVAPFFGAVGLYFVVCSMRFRTFFLYELQVRRAVRWYGAPIAHGSYLVFGLAQMVFAALAWAQRLPF